MPESWLSILKLENPQNLSLEELLTIDKIKTLTDDQKTTLSALYEMPNIEGVIEDYSETDEQGNKYLSEEFYKTI